MTYWELLDITDRKKKEVQRKLNTSLNGSNGWLVKAEIERNPGSLAYIALAKEFLETLSANMEEILQGLDGIDQREIYNIIACWYDDDDDLYDRLPTEARLYDE